MSEQLRVGQILHGYCGGYFGRDSYGSKRIEGIGHDWIVVREDGQPNFACTDDGASISNILAEYTKEYADDL